MKKEFVFIAIMMAVAIPATAFAQEIPVDIPINIGVGHIVVIFLGVAGGATVAILGNSKAKKEDGETYEFDARKFARPFLVAVLTSIPLAIASAAGFAELNVVTMFMIYGSTLGVAELTKRVA